MEELLGVLCDPQDQAKTPVSDQFEWYREAGSVYHFPANKHPSLSEGSLPNIFLLYAERRAYCIRFL